MIMRGQYLVGIMLLWGCVSNPAYGADAETVSIPKSEYEALKRDAESHRQRHDKGGLGRELTQVMGLRITPWKIIGWVAAFLFAGRWLVQMYYSRKAGRPVIPRVYWIVSMVASVLLLAYWTLSPQRASVGVLQNFFPVFVAGYNLYLDIRSSRDSGSPTDPTTGNGSSHGSEDCANESGASGQVAMAAGGVSG